MWMLPIICSTEKWLNQESGEDTASKRGGMVSDLALLDNRMT
jgi:hypothetical protein